MTKLSHLLLLLLLAILLTWNNRAYSQPANVMESARANPRANAAGIEAYLLS